MSFDQPEYYEQTFSKIDESDNKISSIEFDCCTFENCNFEFAEFRSCKFINCQFVNCNLSNIAFSFSTFSDVEFAQCKMIGIDWTKVGWSQFNTTSPIKCFECNLSDNSFYALKLCEIVLHDCRVHRVDFREGNFSKSDFSSSDFSFSQFSNTNLESTNFESAYEYQIDVRINNIKQAKFSKEEAINLLFGLEIEII
ncbi:pentapeptide repeat-containing protein [Marinicellulosiphila megalodicopiae]|uniref:pentapeptide repeat-containing protein n=1 Tax=Marinicellulosiphila megalodicopiae TaxID=2724896 RepID=UPI003BAE2AE0